MTKAAASALPTRDTGRPKAIAVIGRTEVAEMKRIAEHLADENPLWIVMFGDYSMEFVAFPRFAAPRGTIVRALYPDALAPRMRAVESSALHAPGGSPRPEPTTS